MKVKRLANNPIISPGMDCGIGDNINGPSLIRAPEWLPKRLGEYYLYFAHHQGKYIRLAYADSLDGPWRIYEPGTLRVEQTPFIGHVASPDVHVDEANRRIVMYVHGPTEKRQRTCVSTSDDGVNFVCHPEFLGQFYFRVFHWKDYYWAISRSGQTFRSCDGFTDFERGPTLYDDDFRHAAVMLDDDLLSVFYSHIGDCPERILLSTIELNPDWHRWRPSEPVTLLEPETEYEGADQPLAVSKIGVAHERVREVRDPAIYREDGRIWLLYSIAGEAGIAIAELLP